MQTYTKTHSEMQREKTLLRYIRALDEGDMDGVAVVLAAALDDPELDRLLTEIDRSMAEEERLTPLASDAHLVRDLARKHFSSAFPEETQADQPLTVADVAARLQADGRVPVVDQEAHRQLLHSSLIIPAWLNAKRVQQLALELGVAASERFWDVFHDTAIALGMGRGRGQTYMAAAREERGQKHSRSMTSTEADTNEEKSQEETPS